MYSPFLTHPIAQYIVYNKHMYFKIECQLIEIMLHLNELSMSFLYPPLYYSVLKKYTLCLILYMYIYKYIYIYNNNNNNNNNNNIIAIINMLLQQQIVTYIDRLLRNLEIM